MYKIKNKSIEVLNVKTHNRILDNYLDWVIYSMLPKVIGDVLFPKFAAYGFNILPMEYAYLQFITPQVITDSSTIMLYLDKSTERKTAEVITPTGKTVDVVYNFTFGANDTYTFEGLGFGRDDSIVTDFLLSYIDLAPTEGVFVEGNDYAVVRHDEISTNEHIMSGGAGYLPGVTGGSLESISMCYTVDGTDPVKEYHYSELLFAYVSAGKVAVTGFDDFYIENNTDYPTTDYPGADYPRQSGVKIQSVRFKYVDVSGNEYVTYVPIEDLDVSYNNTDMSINLVCERGEY